MQVPKSLTFQFSYDFPFYIWNLYTLPLVSIIFFFWFIMYRRKNLRRQQIYNCGSKKCQIMMRSSFELSERQIWRILKEAIGVQEELRFVYQLLWNFLVMFHPEFLWSLIKRMECRKSKLISYFVWLKTNVCLWRRLWHSSACDLNICSLDFEFRIWPIEDEFFN